MPAARILRLPSLLSSALLFCLPLGCGGDDEGPSKLFEEEGTWTLSDYSLSGTVTRPIDQTNRREAFLMRFHSDVNVVQTAMCGEDERRTPENSACRLLTSETSWFCTCYAYAYEDNRMVWQAFPPGTTPPEVELDPAVGTRDSRWIADTDTDGEPDSPDEPGDTDDSDTDTDEPDPSAPRTEILLFEVPDVASTFTFRPLPEGIWGSDGIASSYTVRQIATSRFDQALNDPDGRPSCEPCVAD